MTLGVGAGHGFIRTKFIYMCNINIFISNTAARNGGMYICVYFIYIFMSVRKRKKKQLPTL